MKYFFSRINTDEYYPGFTNYVDEEGNQYFFEVEFGTNPGGIEDIVISDTCGRSVPINSESIPDLIAVLEQIYYSYSNARNIFSDKIITV